MKRISIILVFMALSVSMFSQDRIPVELNQSRLYLNLFVPSLTYEHKIADNQTVLLTGGLKLYGEEQFDEFEMSLNPFAELEFRNYYPRKKVKKELRPNSGNFVGFLGGYIFGSVVGSSEIDFYSYDQDLYFAGVWGIQRNYNSGIHLNLKLGPGLRIGDGDIDGLLVIDFGLGIQLGN